MGVKQTEALKLALEVSEEFIADYQSEDGMNSMKHYAKKHHAVLTASREALAEDSSGTEQPAPVASPHEQQEPVGRIVVKSGCAHFPISMDFRSVPDGEYNLYTFPPVSKPWVGLTNQELIDLTAIYSGAPLYCAIEAKLREKNT